MNKFQSFTQWLRIIISIIVFVQTISTVSAGNLTLSQKPLFLGGAIPNMLVILDNSLSTEQDILAKAHWERAAYESIYASGKDYIRLGDDSGKLEYCINATEIEKKCCFSPDEDCGILRNDGAVTLSGPIDLGGKKISDANNMNYAPYVYLSSCYQEGAPCGNDDNTRDLTNKSSSCHGPNFSLANCPETEGLDWRVRSAALNVIYYDPNIDYKPWKLSNLEDAKFNEALGNPYPNQQGYDRVVNLDSDAPLGIDPTSCAKDPSAAVRCKLNEFSKGFVYYVWVDDKGYGDPSNPKEGCPKTNDRPHRGACINMTDGPNHMVDLWDTHYKVTVTATSRKVEKITYTGAYDNNGALVYVTGKATDSLPDGVVARNLTPADERQNIANWFQYYHRRLFTFKGLLSNMLYSFPNFRYGLMSMGSNQKINVANDKDLTPIDNLGGNNPLDQELIFEFPIENKDPKTQSIDFQQHNSNLLHSLFSLSYFCCTPLRETLNRAGQYYLYTDASGKPLISSTTVDPITNACQRNYSLIITDGYYTIPSGDSVGTIADEDGDISSVTLADVARYYYSTDLRPLQENQDNFPNILTPARCDNRPPCKDCNQNEKYFPTHQHMVTFGISVGVDGNLKWGDEGNQNNVNADGWPDSIVKNPIKCPPPTTGDINDWRQVNNDLWAKDPQQCSPNDCPEKIDDLWHAAYNSHGAYIPVKTPKELDDALRRVIAWISTDRSFAASASSSSYYTSGSKVFLTSFESQYWTGDLKAYTVNATGELNTDAQGKPISEWSAADALNNTLFSNRNLLTYGAITKEGESTKEGIFYGCSAGENAPVEVQFHCGKGAGTKINAADKWIDTNNFRIRPGMLGDIVQSDPVYVAQPYFRYDEYECDECPDYSDFKEKFKKRTPMVYVGANDGMLHGFDAGDGQEKIAYIPGRLIDKLSSLTSRDYVHQYYVEGSATVGDAYFAGDWHTVLVGSLRAGGQAVFALDISDPDNFSKNAPSATVLWEFSDNNDADLGYTFSKPVIARLHNGKWAAIFGNGYNNTVTDGNVSSSGEAALYIVYLDKDKPPIKIPTSKSGLTIQDPTGANRPNGLATPAVVDGDDDLTADYVYAGDLFGNLWKFDITDPDNAFDITDPDNAKVIRLFTAIDTNKTAQPVTVRPVVDIHPYGKDFGYMIYFGTGKYFEENDNLYETAKTTQQSFYGIWDMNVSSSEDSFDRTGKTTDGKDVLFKQEISDNGKLRTISTESTNKIKWLDEKGKQYNKGWYMDFPLGEKQVTNPTIFNKRVIFTTLVLPEKIQSCDSDGSTSWVMVVDANNGGIPSGGAFKAPIDATVIGQLSEVGALPKVGLIIGGDELFALACGTEGGCATYSINPGIDDIGRQPSWRQLGR